MNYSYEGGAIVGQDEKSQEIALSNIKIEKRFIDKMNSKSAQRAQKI